MATRTPPGYSWKGSVAQQSIEALYNRSAELRFTGRLTLADPRGTVTVRFVGGETIESLGQVVLAEGGYAKGTFEMVQAVPDLEGELTDGVELTGGLGPARVKELIRLADDSRLTADLHLDGGSAGAAKIRFTHGRLEGVEIAGKSDLSALRKVEQWAAGTFRLTLRPLFTSDAPVAAAPLPQAKLLGAQTFDLTGGTMNVGLRGQDLDTTPARGSSLPPARPADKALPTAPPALVAVDDPALVENPMPVEDTDVTRRRALPPEEANPQARPPAKVASGSSRLPIVIVAVVAGVVILGCLAWLLLLRPPSAPPTPPAPLPAKAALVPAAAPSPPPVEKKPRARMHPRAVKACGLIVTGHPRTASEVAAEALRRDPDDEHLGAMLEMAKGKGGKGTLVLEGEGELILCGEKVTAPRQIKLPAGPYLVEDRAAAEIVRVGKGGSATYRRN